MIQKTAIPSFKEATQNGEITNKDGYHQPDNAPRGARGCGCSKTTKKGAYRDVTVEYDGMTIHFYHQSAVVSRVGNELILDSHGYETSTTKERINRYIPAGYRVIQRDYEWFLTTPDGDRVEFTDGMSITV